MSLSLCNVLREKTVNVRGISYVFNSVSHYFKLTLRKNEGFCANLAGYLVEWYFKNTELSVKNVVIFSLLWQKNVKPNPKHLESIDKRAEG
jgi:hypothetical protein